MDELTKEEVYHVSDLAKIEIKDDEVEKYQRQLKQIMNEIDKINEVDISLDDFIISPTLNHNVYRNDECIVESVDISRNAPNANGNYIEVRRFNND